MENAASDNVIPTAPAVRDSLNTILASDPFLRSPRMAGLLKHIVETDLAGQADTLKGYDIGVAVFDKPVDFDPSTDTLVRVETARLRRMLQNHYLHDDGRTTVEITVPKGGYRPAYAYCDGAEEIVASVTEANLPLGPTVVVNAVQVLSDDSGDVLAKGFSHEIRHQLARFSELLVVSASHSDSVDDANASHFTVDGRITIDDDGLRVSLKLTDNTTSRMVWSDDFESARDAGDLANLVTTAAERLVSQMAHTYGPIARQLARDTQTRPASSWSAWECVVEAHDYRARLTTAERNAQLMARVTDLLADAPNDAKLWAVRCDLELDAHLYHFPTAQRPFDWDQLRRRAEHAVSLDPFEINALTGLAMVLWLIGEVDTSFKVYEQALETNPNQMSTVYTYGQFIAFNGDWPRGRAFVKKAQALGYLPPVTKLFHLNDLVKHGKLEQAVAVAETLYNRHWYMTAFWHAVVYGLVGDGERGRAAATSLMTLHPDYPEWGLDILTRWVRDPDLIASCCAGLAASGIEFRDR